MLSPRKLCTKLNKIFAICLVPTQWQRQQQQQPTSCIVPACDDRRTRSIVRWHLKWLEKQLVGLGWDSNCTSLWIGRFLGVSFLCTKPLFIFLFQQDYPTDCKSVIECLYSDAATESIVNQNFQLIYFCYDVFLVHLYGLFRVGLTVSYNSWFLSASRCLLVVLVT